MRALTIATLHQHTHLLNNPNKQTNIDHIRCFLMVCTWKKMLSLALTLTHTHTNTHRRTHSQSSCVPILLHDRMLQVLLTFSLSLSPFIEASVLFASLVDTACSIRCGQALNFSHFLSLIIIVSNFSLMTKTSKK